MLKIKNNVDLKELEKLGFIKNKQKIALTNHNITYYYKCFAKGITYISIIIESGYIIISKWDNSNRNQGLPKNPKCKYRNNDMYLDGIYDLIQAGLVEKVSE